MKSEKVLISDTEQALRYCLEDVPFVQIEDTQTGIIIGNRRPDLVARLRTPIGDITLIIEVKSSGQPRIARLAVSQIESLVRDMPKTYGVFIAPYISPQAAEICTRSNIGYIDLAGNCRLSFWPIYIKSTGSENPSVKKRALKSLYSSTSLKTTTILRVFLENPKRVWKIQELANAADASIGQTSNVKRQLEDREWISSTPDGFQLINPVELLTDWSRHYNNKRNKRYDFYSIKSIPDIEAELADYCNKENMKYALSGFSGGVRYAPSIRYQRAMAYTNDDDITRISEALDLKEVTSGANISIIAPYDQNTYYGSRIIDGIWIASPVQTYLDLKSTPGRGEEAADTILREEIEPVWR